MKSQKNLTVVIKLGTSSIVDEKTYETQEDILDSIVDTAVKLHKNGHKVVIVSSGAIGVGLQRMGMGKRPKQLAKKQALAAVGQCRLMSLWNKRFKRLAQPMAQILLTRNDIADRAQYLNAQNTFSELFNMGVIPIVNENDTIAVAEIKFGDNDTLSAITAAMVQADYLFLMTDVDCLYTANPRTNPDAKPIEVVSDLSTLAADVSSAGSALGTGGMSTKLVAARLATSAGVTTIITRSSRPGNIIEIVEYLQTLPSPPTTLSSVSKPPLHTRFLPASSPIRDRSFWLLHGLTPHGTIYIDEGAYRALLNKAGLLPVGVVDVSGPFSQHEAVRLVVVKRIPGQEVPPRQVPIYTPSTSTAHSSGTSTPVTPLTALSLSGIASYESGDGYEDPMLSSASLSTPASSSTFAIVPQKFPFEQLDPCPREVGRALVNYSSAEIARIKGLRSGEIGTMLGYMDSEYVAQRENISLTKNLSGEEKREAEEENSLRSGTEPTGGSLGAESGKRTMGNLGAFV